MTFTDQQKEEIVRLYRNHGITMLDISSRFNATVAEIFAVITASNPK